MFVAAFLLSGFMWLGIIWLISLAAQATDFKNDPAYQPPRCSATACPMYGPGGLIIRWKEAALLAHGHGKLIVVPPGKVCASACALAVGYAMGNGFDVEISESAVFIPHNRKAIQKTRMPPAFKAKMLAYKPFSWREPI